MRRTSSGRSLAGPAAVKPAGERTRSGVVVVLATPATLERELFTATAGRHAAGIRVIGEPCPGLVARIESGQADSPETERMLRVLAAGLAAGADHIVLACTHYPLVIDTIRRLAGPSVEVVDPAPAVVRQLGRVLAHRQIEAPAERESSSRLLTTGADVPAFAAALAILFGAPRGACVGPKTRLS